MGGRSSGGGQAVQEYPPYLMAIQGDWLAGMEDYTQIGTRTAFDKDKSISWLLMDTIGEANPYTAALAYDPTWHIGKMADAALAYLPRQRDQVIAYKHYRDAITTEFDTELAAIEDALLGTAAIGGIDSAMGDLDNINPSIYLMDNSLDEALAYVQSLDTTEKVEQELTGFNTGMREINAVNSSAFVVGTQVVASGLLGTKATLRSELAKAKDEKARAYVMMLLDKYKALLDAAIRKGQLSIERARGILQAIISKYQVRMDAEKVTFGTVAHSVGDAARLIIDARRLGLVAFKEEAEENLRIESRDAMWDLEVFQAGANVMAAISGGTVTSTEDGPGKVQSALGGALSGAAAGASISGGNPFGAAAGAVVGIGASLFG